MKKLEQKRGDRYGVHRTVYLQAREKVIRSGEVCGICGLPVDKHLKFPHPLSATVDHIIPIDKGGHPTDINNMQLAHFKCNRIKSNKILDGSQFAPQNIGNRVLPLTYDWLNYKDEKG